MNKSKKSTTSPLLVVGLTGGIASGKSTVAQFMKQAGALIVDADHIARLVVRPGSPAYEDIRRVFGAAVIGPDGEIDRPTLGKLIFGNETLRRKLEAIIHPRVQQAMEDDVRRIGREHPGAVVLKDIPLLLETGMIQGLAEIIVVYVPEAVQFERLMLRDNLPLDQAMARIRSQMPIEEKKKRATLLIDNSQSLDCTRSQVLAIYAQLAARAAAASVSHHMAQTPTE